MDEHRPGKIIEFDDVTRRAILVVGNGWDMVSGLARADHIVVAGRATANNAVMIIEARGESARRVTDMTILGGWHVDGRLTKPRTISRLAMTLRTIVDDIGMVIDAIGEIAATDTMAHAAVGARWHVIRLGGLPACIDTIVIVVAGSARQHTGINKAVAVYAAHAEARGAMANTAIDGHIGMAYGLSLRVRAVVTAGAIVCDITVVHEGILKTVRRVAGTTVGAGDEMPIILADGNGAVVARGTGSRNIGMIIFAIRSQFQKAGGGVAVIAFRRRRDMKFGFANGQYPVMTCAAISENFLMIDVTDQVESEGCVTGLA